MAIPPRKPTKRTSSVAGKKKATAPKKSVAKAPVRKTTRIPAPSFDTQMQSAAARAPRIPSKKPAIDPNSFLALVKSLKAAFGGRHVTFLEVPWEERDIARSLGAEWIEKLNGYVYVGDLLPARLENYASTDYSYMRWIEDQVNGKIKPVPKPSDGYYTPKPHQVEAIEAIKNTAAAGWRGFIEADMTGLGKSISGLVGASEVAAHKGFTAGNKAKVLIICPNGAIAHWKNTIRHLQVDNLRIMVVNYESYKKLLTVPKAAKEAKKQKTKNKHISTQGKSFFSWNIIISDESQKLKNVTSQRTQAFERIAQYALEAKIAPYVIWMSATAGQTPLELGYLCPIIAQAARTKITMETWPEWLANNKFHVTKKGKTWQWVKPTGPNDVIARERQKQDVERLASILFHPKAPSIRRKPEDIAGWPPVNRIAMPVQLTTVQKDKYDQLWTEFRKEMNLSGRGSNPKGILAMQLRFAQKASLLRVGQTVDNAASLVEAGQQVAISVRFLETLDAIRAGLKTQGIECSEFSGRTYIDKEKERIDFQKGKTQVILFTVEEAVSFHAKESLPDGTKASAATRSLLVHDMRYSALSMTQIIGRTHRDGQNSNAYFLYSENTVEERIMNIMMNKLENMTLLSGDTEEDAIVEMVEELIAA